MEPHKQIVDQYNQPINKSYYTTSRGISKAARSTGISPSHSKADLPFDQLFPSRDQISLRDAGRTLYTNVSTVHATINQKASYSVGRGFVPMFGTDDKEWATQADKWIKKWYKRCNTRGNAYHLKKTLELISIALDRDGDIFILLTKSKTGYPLLQLVDASRVGNRDGETEMVNGRYKGAKIASGVITNKYSRPVAYKILGQDPDGKQDVVVPAQSMIHVFDPKWIDANRGLTCLVPCIDTYKNLASSTEYELLAQAIQGQMAIAVQSESGKADMSDPYGTNETGEFLTETIEGGRIQYFDSNGNGKIDMMTPSARPSDQYQKFQKTLSTEAIAAMGWSINIVLQSEGSSSITRSEISKVQKSIEARQSILRDVAYSLVTYALSCGITRGDIPAHEDYLNFEFSGTRSISIDLQRDSNARISEYNAGLRTLQDLISEEGKDWKQHGTDAIEEQAYLLMELDRIEAKYNLEGRIDPRSVRMLTPNEQAPTKED